MNFKKTADTLELGAHTLQREYYIDPNILDKEYKSIFQKQWICVGRSNDIKKPGQFITHEIGEESIIIVRDKDKGIKAHYNVCRHRGTRICNDAKGTFPKSIQCGYHGWTYALDGSLIGAPHMNEVENFDKKNYGLHSVSVNVWEGFIFISLSNEPDDFDKVFSSISNRFSRWGISDLETFKTIEYQVDGNWKLVIQNYCECYHCPILHPELASIHNYMGGRNDLYDGPILGGYMDFNEGKESITSNAEFCCPPFPEISENDKNRVYYYSIFPNMLLSLHPEYVMYHIIFPKDTNKCIVSCSWLFLDERIKNHKNYALNDAVEFWDMTNKQDWHISELSQLGIQSKMYSPAPYSGQESLLAAFDKHYKQSLK